MVSQLLELLRRRRSTRQFTSRPIEADKLKALVEAAVRAPTSRGRNPWEFIVVTDQALLEKLGSAKVHGAALLTGAPLAIVVAADPARSDVWTEDCSIAATLIQLTAEDLGLGSCWVQIRLRQHATGCRSSDYVRMLLGLPANHEVACIIGIGYPVHTRPGHPDDSLPYNQVHRDRFGI
jgi:nitroreductase